MEHAHPQLVTSGVTSQLRVVTCCSRFLFFNTLVCHASYVMFLISPLCSCFSVTNLALHVCLLLLVLEHMVALCIVAPVVVGSNPIAHPPISRKPKQIQKIVSETRWRLSDSCGSLWGYCS
jgi:hypothetical protein